MRASTLLWTRAPSEMVRWAGTLRYVEQDLLKVFQRSLAEPVAGRHSGLCLDAFPQPPHGGWSIRHSAVPDLLQSRVSEPPCSLQWRESQALFTSVKSLSFLRDKPPPNQGRLVPKTGILSAD